LECFLHGWNATDRVGIPLNRVGMLSRGLEYHGQSWNIFEQSWNAYYRVGMLSSGLECFRQSWNTFLHG
jgi:hypothetical protein